MSNEVSPNFQENIQQTPSKVATDAATAGVEDIDKLKAIVRQLFRDKQELKDLYESEKKKYSQEISELTEE